MRTTTLSSFLRGQPAMHANPSQRTGLTPVFQRLLDAPPAGGMDFLLDRLWTLDWWLRGRMMRSRGYVDDLGASREELVLRDHMRELGTLLRDASADPRATTTLYRAVAPPQEALPAAGWHDLPGRVWRTARRPLQSWTDTLASARDFARSLSGRAYVEQDGAQFIVEAEIPAAHVLLRYDDLERALGAVVETPQAAALHRAARSCLEVLRLLAQREVVVELPRGETPITAVHAIDD